MKQKELPKEAARLASSIISLLNSGNYFARSEEVEYGDGQAFGNEVTIYEKDENIFRKIFPRKIVSVATYGFWSGYSILSAKSFDRNRITQSRLEEALKPKVSHIKKNNA